MLGCGWLLILLFVLPVVCLDDVIDVSDRAHCVRDIYQGKLMYKIRFERLDLTKTFLIESDFCPGSIFQENCSDFVVCSINNKSIVTCNFSLRASENAFTFKLYIYANESKSVNNRPLFSTKPLTYYQEYTQCKCPEIQSLLRKENTDSITFLKNGKTSIKYKNLLFAVRPCLLYYRFSLYTRGVFTKDIEYPRKYHTKEHILLNIDGLEPCQKYTLNVSLNAVRCEIAEEVPFQTHHFMYDPGKLADGSLLNTACGTASDTASDMAPAKDKEDGYIERTKVVVIGISGGFLFLFIILSLFVVLCRRQPTVPGIHSSTSLISVRVNEEPVYEEPVYEGVE